MIVLGFIGLAALGTLARVIISHHLNQTGFPYGTLFINITGAFFLGLIAGSGSDALIIFGIGALGAMTTFSTLTQEAVQLSSSQLSNNLLSNNQLSGNRGLRLKRFGLSLFYIATTLVAGVGAAWGGLAISGATS